MPLRSRQQALASTPSLAPLYARSAYSGVSNSEQIPVETPAPVNRQHEPGFIYNHRRAIAKLALVTTGFFYIATQSKDEFHRLMTPGCQINYHHGDNEERTFKNALFDNGVADPGKATLYALDGTKTDITGLNGQQTLEDGSAIVLTDVPNTVCDAIGHEFGSDNPISRWKDLSHWSGWEAIIIP